MYTHASVDDLDIFYHIITDSLEICDSFFLDPLSRGHDGYPGRIGGQVLGANPPGGGVQGQRFPAGEQGLPGRQDRLRRRGRRLLRKGAGTAAGCLLTSAREYRRARSTA